MKLLLEIQEKEEGNWAEVELVITINSTNARKKLKVPTQETQIVLRLEIGKSRLPAHGRIGSYSVLDLFLE